MDPEVLKGLRESGAILTPKRDSPLMRILGFFLGGRFRWAWTTWRLPGQKFARIGHPDAIADPTFHDMVIRHELHHVRQFAPWWGPWWVIFCASVFPLPILFSGRWWIEREPYLEEIQRGQRDLEAVVRLLWHGYGWCWPRPLMRRWFQRKLK